MARQAETVAAVTVLGHPDGALSRVRYREFELRVDRVLEGYLPYPEIRLLTMPGYEPGSGNDSSSKLSVPADPAPFRSGDRWVLFLNRAAGSQYALVPAGDGRLPIITTSGGDRIRFALSRPLSRPRRGERQVRGFVPNVTREVDLARFSEILGRMLKAAEEERSRRRRTRGQTDAASGCCSGKTHPAPRALVDEVSAALGKRLGTRLFDREFELQHAAAIGSRGQCPRKKPPVYSISFRHHFQPAPSGDPPYFDYELRIDESGRILHGLDGVPHCAADPALCRFVTPSRLWQISDDLMKARLGEALFEHGTREKKLRITQGGSWHAGPIYNTSYTVRFPTGGKSGPEAHFELIFGSDGTLLRGLDKVPECKNDPNGCLVLTREDAARIARDAGYPVTNRGQQGKNILYSARCSSLVWHFDHSSAPNHCSGKIVTIDAQHGAVCDDGGSWHVTDCPGPSHGYEPVDLLPPPPAPIPAGAGTLIVDVERMGVDGNPLPVAAAEIRLRGSGIDRSASTNGSGEVRFEELPLGTGYDIYLRQENCLPIRRSQIAIPSAVPVRHRFQIGRRIDLRVHIQRAEADGSIWPQCGARLEFRYRDDPRSRYSFGADERGNVTIPCVETGRGILITARSDGYHEATRILAPLTENRPDVSVTLTPANGPEE